MPKYKIIVDSSCDIPSTLISGYDYFVADLMITVGEREFRDRVDITPRELFELCEKENITPHTQALNINDLQNLFTPFIEEGYDHIFFMPISSHISSINSNAHMVVEMNNWQDKVTVLDSGQLSTGLGLLLIGLGEDCNKGLPVEKIVENHYKRVPKVAMSFVIDRLDYLYKGGRCNGMTYVFGNALSLHPVIRLEEGEMNVYKLVRDKGIKKGTDNQIDTFLEDYKNGNVDLAYPILIPNAEAPEGVKRVKDKLRDVVGDQILFEIDASGIICCHCGPNTLGLAYMLKHPRTK